MKTLKGISWDHPRGFGPLPPTAAQFAATHPDVQIVWEKRSLHDFGAYPVDELARNYDLVVLDHPWVGFVSQTRCYLPMDELLPRAVLDELAGHSVGPSHRSYEWDGHQWALAIDAATPVASYRPDLLAGLGMQVPATWQQVLELGREARAAGMRIGMPMGPVDAISVFLTLADNIGGQPFATTSRVVSNDVARTVINAMRRLAELCDPVDYTLTPITLMDRMSTTDQIVYCPLAYGYNNYSRAGFRPKLCLYADMPSLGNDGPKGSHIGGTGIAISTKCQYPQLAAEYCAWVCGGECQRTTYFDHGGQPGHSQAWDDPRVNRVAHDFFRNTRQTIERAYLRPRYNGYIRVQYEGGAMIQKCLRDNGDVDQLVRDLNGLYQQSLGGHK